VLFRCKPLGAVSPFKERTLSGIPVGDVSLRGRPEAEFRRPGLAAPKLPISPAGHRRRPGSGGQHSMRFGRRPG
jgi:hypothetical protein